MSALAKSHLTAFICGFGWAPVVSCGKRPLFWHFVLLQNVSPDWSDPEVCAQPLWELIKDKAQGWVFCTSSSQYCSFRPTFLGLLVYNPKFHLFIRPSIHTSSLVSFPQHHVPAAGADSSRLHFSLCSRLPLVRLRVSLPQTASFSCFFECSEVRCIVGGVWLLDLLLQ